jgi:hypothetical protein
VEVDRLAFDVLRLPAQPPDGALQLADALLLLAIRGPLLVELAVDVYA